MILYHGSKEIVEFPKIRKVLYHKDFYFGFYRTLQKWEVTYLRYSGRANGGFLGTGKI